MDSLSSPRLLLSLILVSLSLSWITAEEACSLCRCSDLRATSSQKVMTVDCSSRLSENMFKEASDWPYQLKGNETPPVLMEVKLDRNSLVLVHKLPSVPIVKFSVTHNQISTIEDGAFAETSSTLEEIDLSSNRLTSDALHPNAFTGVYAPETYLPLKKVKVIRLGRNALHSLHPDLFQHLPALEEVYLDFNPMNVLDIVTVKAISSVILLKVLDLSNTGLSTLPDNFLHTPRFLEKLDISGNEISHIPSTLEQAKELKTLILDENPIRRLDNDTFPSLPKLTMLSISRMMELEVIEDGSLSKLSSLQKLYCAYNPNLVNIETYALGVISDSDEPQPITTFILNNNRLAYLSRHLVNRWDKLEEIALQGNPWSCDCINQWMVTDLAPILEKINPDMMSGMMCYEPPEMAGQTLRDLVFHAPHLRCLDKFSNHPEGDSAMLIGVLVGALLAVPIAFCLFLIWRRRENLQAYLCPGQVNTSSGRFHGPGAGDYSRAFYKRADTAGGDI